MDITNSTRTYTYGSTTFIVYDNKTFQIKTDRNYFSVYVPMADLFAFVGAHVAERFAGPPTPVIERALRDLFDAMLAFKGDDD